MQFEKLEQNIIDLVKEEQAKLGYRKECIRLYYPLSSLMHLTGKSCGEQEMLTLLSDFCREAEPHLGKITVSAKKERFCFLIPEEGVVYVKETRFQTNLSKSWSNWSDAMTVPWKKSKHCLKNSHGRLL